MSRFCRFAFAIFAIALTVSCRGKQSMASRSAAAYRDAVAKGIPVAAGEGHGAEHRHDMSSMQHEPMQDMKNLPGMQHGSMPGMDHSKMQHGAMHDMKAMPGMQHGSMSGMAGMEHGSPGGPSAVVAAPSTSSGIAQLSPRSTLQQDEFDRPAAAQPASQTQPQPPTEKQQL